MYLARVQAENFRIFGAVGTEESPGSALDVTFAPGLSVLVGENDSGKSAVIDAIRLCVPSSADTARISMDDFHCGPDGPASRLQITCTFRGLTGPELGFFDEFLTSPQDGETCLVVRLRAERSDPLSTRTAVTVTAGAGALQGEVREQLRATYLRPLRDAKAAMGSGRNSRLSQILLNYPSMKNEKDNDFDAKTDQARSLVGIMARADHHIDANPLVNQARDEINNDYLSKFVIGADDLTGTIGIASQAGLQQVLERLELTFAPVAGVAEPTRHGLGYDNALFMAAELLLLGKNSSPLLLIEEPEAHMHPQLQSRVVDLLRDHAAGTPAVQTIVTTHSPHIASSVPVEQLTIVARGRTYPLRPDQTKLNASDYAFLTRFLDATKANLFFARAVAIVEGDAEALLLPSLAAALGHSFSRSGVSIVNVGHVGLFRYARIFQRNDNAELPVRVACITDMDLAPDAASEAMRKHLKRWSDLTDDQRRERVAKRSAHDGGVVKTYVSDKWTLEYDLALASWPMATIMHQAVTAAGLPEWPTEQDLDSSDEVAAKEVEGWRSGGWTLEEAALEIYRPLRVGGVSKAIAAQLAARRLATTPVTADDLPDYLVAAIGYLCQDSPS